MLRTLIVLLALACASGVARAALVQLDYSVEFSNGTAPAGLAPWMSALFADIAPGAVRLTLSTGGLSGAENVSGAYFNLDPALAPGALGFAYQAALSTGAQASAIRAGPDCCKADGDGNYDIALDFPTGAGFGAGKSVVYDISYSGSGTLQAMSFAFVSAPGGGNGPFYAAAQVQNTGSGGHGSGWIAPQSLSSAPLPSPLGLAAAGFALLALGARRRIRHRQASAEPRIPRLMARATAWLRFSTPILRRIFWMWFFTV